MLKNGVVKKMDCISSWLAVIPNGSLLIRDQIKLNKFTSCKYCNKCGRIERKTLALKWKMENRKTGRKNCQKWVKHELCHESSKLLMLLFSVSLLLDMLPCQLYQPFQRDQQNQELDALNVECCVLVVTRRNAMQSSGQSKSA